AGPERRVANTTSRWRSAATDRSRFRSIKARCMGKGYRTRYGSKPGSSSYTTSHDKLRTLGLRPMELHASIHEDDDGKFWAEVRELPGCFASGATLDELHEALVEAIGMCLPAKRTRGKKQTTARARVDEMKLVT